MNRKVINNKLTDILKEDVENFTPSNDEYTEDQLKNIINVTGDLEGEDGSVTDILFDPDNREVIEFKLDQENNPLINFVPLSDFQPEVYGLDSDVFDQVEQDNDIDISIDTIDTTEVEDEVEGISYEEEKGFQDGRAIAEIEDDVTFTDDDFEGIDDERLLEYAWSKGIEFSTRKGTIQKLFEHGRVTREDLLLFREEVRKEECNESVQQEVLNYGEDSFIEKYGKDLDFRYIEGEVRISSQEEDPGVYETLNDMEEEEWEEYVTEMSSYGVTVEYDTLADEFVLANNTGLEDDNEEVYDIEEEDRTIIENIMKETSYRLVEVRGLPKKTKKDYILEAVVEKDGYREVVRYNDNENYKPWSIKEKRFSTLRESLNHIIIPFKTLVNDTFEANKKDYKRKMFLEKIQKENFNKTKNLPLSEKERRKERSVELIKEMFPGEVDAEEYLTELNKLKRYKRENED